MLSEATSGFNCSAGCSRSSTVIVGAPPVVRLTTTFEAALIFGRKRMNIFGSCVGRPSAGSRACRWTIAAPAPAAPLPPPALSCPPPPPLPTPRQSPGGAAALFGRGTGPGRGGGGGVCLLLG